MTDVSLTSTASLSFKSALFVAWGQLLSYDLALTQDNTSEPFDVPCNPADDNGGTDVWCPLGAASDDISFFRSALALALPLARGCFFYDARAKRLVYPCSLTCFRFRLMMPYFEAVCTDFAPGGARFVFFSGQVRYLVDAKVDYGVTEASRFEYFFLARSAQKGRKNNISPSAVERVANE